MKLISSRGWQCLGAIPIANLSGIFSFESKRSSRVDVCMAFVAVLKMTWPEFDHFFTILFIFCLQVPKSQGVIFLPGDKLWTSFSNIVSEMMVLFPMFLLLSCCVLQQPPHNAASYSLQTIFAMLSFFTIRRLSTDPTPIWRYLLWMPYIQWKGTSY